MNERFVYKIVEEDAWRRAALDGVFAGAEIDRRDGYIHCSTSAQVRQTAERHFAGRAGLLLLELAADRLGPALRWEPSRGGALFPHVYGVLPLDAVCRIWRLPVGSAGRHEWPPLGA